MKIENVVVPVGRFIGSLVFIEGMSNNMVRIEVVSEGSRWKVGDMAYIKDLDIYPYAVDRYKVDQLHAKNNSIPMRSHAEYDAPVGTLKFPNIQAGDPYYVLVDENRIGYVER